jgi:hypothetical protein
LTPPQDATPTTRVLCLLQQHINDARLSVVETSSAQSAGYKAYFLSVIKITFKENWHLGFKG